MSGAEQVVGVIGGSGLYGIDGLEEREEVTLSTPFGAPSDAFLTGRLGSVRTVFLPRHGRGHRIGPTEINFRANIFGMKALGVTRILSLSAVGSLREDVSLSARRLAVALALFGAAAAVAFWLVAALCFALVAALALWLPLWATALVLVGLLLIGTALLGLRVGQAIDGAH